MKKNSDKIFTSIETNPITGEYYTVIPEQFVNEFDWYEETQIRWLIDGDEVIIKEEK